MTDSIGLPPEDAALIKRIQAGDAAAFTEVINMHANGALRIAYRLLYSRDAAKDVLQNVFSDWWARREQISPERSIRTFLFAAVRYQASKELRQHNVRTGQRGKTGAESGYRSLIDPDTIAVQSAERAIDDRITIEVLLAKLPERRRLALQLRYLEQLPFGDIAQVMGISLKAAEHLVLRALQDLRRVAR